MTTLRGAAQQALEALDSDNPEIQLRAAIALRERLSQPEQEPVAEIQAEDMGRPFNAKRVTTHFYAEVPAVGTKLYTAPPKRELTCVCGAVWEGEMMVHPPRKADKWVGMTDEEIMEPWPFENRIAFARWLESKIKEKNT